MSGLTKPAKISWCLVLVLLALLVLGLDVPAQVQAANPATHNVNTNSNSPTTATALLKDMQLLTSDTGWVLTEQQLLWTANGGKAWTDITPAAFAGSSITNVFFLDAATGWVVATSNTNKQLQFQFATTTDAGKTWTTQTMTTANGYCHHDGRRGSNGGQRKWWRDLDGNGFKRHVFGGG